MNQPQSIQAELNSAVIMSEYKHAYSYDVSGVVKNGSSARLAINTDNDAHFKCESITISARGPVDENGISVGANGQTDFPLADISTVASAGLTIKITDNKSGRELTSGEIPVELLATPGYGTQIYVPKPFNYLVSPNAKIIFEIRNRDSAVGVDDSELFHSISIAMNGHKIYK